jgi:hypothetical protein
MNDKSIKITLSVYSGSPNPQWELNEGPEYNRLIELIKNLQAKEESLFNYSKWNRLGYASFWIEPMGFEELPCLIHIRRDEAYIIQDKKGTKAYALNASGIYDMLVSQAEEKGLTRFFEKYKKDKEEYERNEILRRLAYIMHEIEEIKARLGAVERFINSVRERK